MEIIFSNWKKWNERETLESLNYPGIYCIAISNKNISNTHFNWIIDIKYIGMTNSRAGLKSRLKQFDNTISGKHLQHGGADRFRYKHEDYSKLTDQLYVTVQPFKCDVKSNKPADLKIMGEVVKHEYDCFAEYVRVFGELPDFNNKQNAPKYSIERRKEGKQPK